MRRQAIIRLGNRGFLFQKYTGQYLLLLNVDVLGRGVKDESWVCDLASWYQKLRWGRSRGTGLMGEEEKVDFGAGSLSCP